MSTQEISITPNPTKSFVQIQGIEDKDYKIQLGTLEGRVLMTDQLTTTHTFDISSFSNGMYIISIQDLETGEVMTKKIIKE